MIRAAAKNQDDVAVIVDPADYTMLLDDMAENGGAVTRTLRAGLPKGLCPHCGL